MSQCEALFGEKKLIPLAVVDDPHNALPLAETLVRAGLPIAEVAFRTEGSLESLKIMARCPGMTAGAGTVVTLEQAEKARDAGAAFIVTPGFSREVTEFCLQNGLPVFPGVATPTELMTVLSCGLHTVKLFPAEELGGLPYIRALSGPFPHVRFIPTGGVNEKNLASYLACPAVLAAGGSFMVARSLIQQGDFGEIARRTSAALKEAGL